MAPVTSPQLYLGVQHLRSQHIKGSNDETSEELQRPRCGWSLAEVRKGRRPDVGRHKPALAAQGNFRRG